jgi:hypothetical protein
VSILFVIEDETHAEPQGEFDSLQSAVAELRRRAEIAWDRAPNLAPCVEWKTCGRRYEIVEYDSAHSPWREIRRVHALNVSASGVRWVAAFARA